MRRSYSQIKQEKGLFITVQNTVWLYPEGDITRGLASTTYRYVYDGDFISSPDFATLVGVYGDIFNQTAISQPVDNSGFTVGVGTLLEDLGKELRFKLDSGPTVVTWRLVRQLTPQEGSTVIPSPGNSPNGTIGYVTTFASYGRAPTSGLGTNILDDVNVLQIG